MSVTLDNVNKKVFIHNYYISMPFNIYIRWKQRYSPAFQIVSFVQRNVLKFVPRDIGGICQYNGRREYFHSHVGRQRNCHIAVHHDSPGVSGGTRRQREDDSGMSLDVGDVTGRNKENKVSEIKLYTILSLLIYVYCQRLSVAWKSCVRETMMR